MDYFKDGVQGDLSVAMNRFVSLQAGTDYDYQARKQLRYLKGAMCGDGCYQDILSQGLDILISTDLRSKLSKIKVPTVWVLGEDDRLIPVAVKDRLLSYCSHARVRVLKNCAHAPFVSNSDKFLEIITEFVYG